MEPRIFDTGNTFIDLKILKLKIFFRHKTQFF